MAKSVDTTKKITRIKKRSRSSGNPSSIKRASMNKNQKRSYKKYRGQGK